MIRRVSPAQVPPAEGVNVPVGGRSVLHPLLLANGDPYPPMPVVEIVVFVPAGILGVTVVIAGVAATVIVVYPV